MNKKFDGYGYAWFNQNGEVERFYDFLCCCHGNGESYCGECYTYGYEHTNCVNAGDIEGGVPVVWDKTLKKFISVK